MANGPESEPGPSNWLVRSFSDELHEKSPGDTLSRGLATKVAVDRHREAQLGTLREQWNLFLLEGREMALHSVPAEEAILLSQSRKLYTAWTKFCQQLPEDQRQGMIGEVPSIQTLFRSVQKASTTWRENREGKPSGRLKQVFANLCNNFKDHSTLLSVIPREDKYVCLLTGSLSAIAQASINHQEIASGVADSLEELSEDIRFWNSLVTEHGNDQTMHRYIRELYVVVFEFLTQIFTTWSTSSWKRFLTSFDERAFNKLFNEKRSRMRAIEQRMLRQSNLEFQKGMTQMSEKVKNMEAGFQTIMSNQVNAVTDQRDLLLTLGLNVQRLLQQRAEQTALESNLEKLSLTEGFASNPTLSVKGLVVDPDASSSPNLAAQGTKNEDILLRHGDEEIAPLTSQRFHRDAILNALKPIVDKFSEHIQSIVDVTSQASQIMISSPVQARLISWTKDTDSNALWIQGPHDVSNVSQNALTAVCLVALSRQNDIPCITYFCTLDAMESTIASELSYKKLLKDMIQSLIVQLVILMPERVITSVDLSSERFEKLQKDFFSIHETLQLLRDLRSLAPSYLHCIIDSAQILENREDKQHMKDLINTLSTLATMHRDNLKTIPSRNLETAQSVNEEQCPLQITKLCFTTDGYVDALAQLVENDSLDKIEYSDEADARVEEESVGLMPHWTKTME